MMKRSMVSPGLGCWLRRAFKDIRLRGPVHYPTAEMIVETKSNCGVPPRPSFHRDSLATGELHEYDFHADSARMGIPKMLLFLRSSVWLTPLLTHPFLPCCQYIQAARSSLVGWEPFWIFRTTWQISAPIHVLLLSCVCNLFPLFPGPRGWRK